MLKLNEMFVRRFGNKEGYKDGVIYTEVLENKVYKTFQNGVVRFKKLATEPENEPNLNSANLEWLVPKIPFKYYQMTLDFYKEVNEIHGTEASVLFYWNANDVEIPADLMEEYGSGIIQDGKLIVIAPKQTNSTSLSEFVETVYVEGTPKKVLTPMLDWLEKNTVCIAETHSHNTMSAFWSPTDNDNERHSRLRLFVVFGKVSTTEVTRSRVCMLNDYFDLDITDVFDMPIMEEKVTKTITVDNKVIETIEGEVKRSYVTGPFGFNNTHPQSWFELFTARKYTAPKNKGVYHGKRPSFIDDVSFLQGEMADMFDEDGEIIDLDSLVSGDEEVEEEWEEEEDFDHEKFPYRRKDIMSLSDEEYFKAVKRGDFGI